jgi:hypothetical protein
LPPLVGFDIMSIFGDEPAWWTSESESPPPPEHGLAGRIHARLAAPGGAELELPARRDTPRAADFDL